MALCRSGSRLARRLLADLHLQPAITHARADRERRVVPCAHVPRASSKARVMSGTAVLLLGFVGGLVIAASQAPSRAPRSPRERADAFRVRALEAQQHSARAARHARELTAQWSEAEIVAHREEEH